ncbi:hypothetical protein F4819DRAFT_469064 [Hypoxylon fuscum]|nr:hypothetical protein F4819DRAFT_469064 [Hypoxylon fuscum]
MTFSLQTDFMLRHMRLLLANLDTYTFAMVVMKKLRLFYPMPLSIQYFRPTTMIVLQLTVYNYTTALVSLITKRVISARPKISSGRRLNSPRETMVTRRL